MQLRTSDRIVRRRRRLGHERKCLVVSFLGLEQSDRSSEWLDRVGIGSDGVVEEALGALGIAELLVCQQRRADEPLSLEGWFVDQADRLFDRVDETFGTRGVSGQRDEFVQDPGVRGVGGERREPAFERAIGVIEVLKLDRRETSEDCRACRVAFGVGRSPLEHGCESRPGPDLLQALFENVERT